jgi:O-antigen/teichoic acid export membrane protein
VSTVKQIKRLAGESFVYGIAGIFTRFIGLFLFPFYSKVLLPKEYGILGMYNATFFFLFLFVAFSMDSAAFRFFFDSDASDNKQRKIVSNWFFFQMTTSAVLIIITFLLSNFWGKVIFGDYVESSRLIKLMALAIVLYAIPNILEVWYRIQRKPIDAVLFALITSSLSILISLWCILKLKLGVKGFIYGQIAGYLIGSVYGLLILKEWIKIKLLDKRLIRSMLHYASPLIPAAIASQALVFLTSYYLKSNLDFTQLGLYSIGNTLASAIGLITGAFGQAWSPFAFSISNSNSAPKTYSTVLTLYCLLLGFVCLTFSIFLPDILKVLTNHNYYDSEIVGTILSYNIFFVSTSVIGITGCGIIKKTAPYAKAVIFGSILSLILMMVLGHFLEKEGAALGILLGQLIIPIIVFKSSQQYYPIPYSFKKVGAIISTSILLTIFCKLFISNTFSLIFIGLKVVIIMFFLVITLMIIRKEIKAVIIFLKARPKSIKELGIDNKLKIIS